MYSLNRGYLIITVVSGTVPRFPVKEGTHDENWLSTPWESICMKGCLPRSWFMSDLKPPVTFQNLWLT